MAAMLETPSRIWRRIEAIQDTDMPSLPDITPYEGSEEELLSSDILQPSDDDNDDNRDLLSSPIHSTPASLAHHTAVSTIRPMSSTNSTARFAHSVASRSAKSSLALSSRGQSTRRGVDSFDISHIPSLPDIHATAQHSDETDEHDSEPSVPDVYLPPPEDDDNEELSLTDALQPLSRSNSPFHPDESFNNSAASPKKGFDGCDYYDYAVGLRSESKASPIDKYRNVAMRRNAARTRTPSLSHTTSSQTSSPPHTTPKSTRSPSLPRSNEASPMSATAIPLPRSHSGSPAIVIHEPEDTTQSDIRSMDITDVHISPIRSDDDQQSIEDDQSEGVLQLDEDNVQLGSLDEREPTFSSDEDPTPYAASKKNTHITSSSAQRESLSPPTQSFAFTPTPAFPRPRARFNIPPPPKELFATPNPHLDQTSDPDQPEEVPLTPHTRRRSFLLSVINSTTRPRLRFPTPHPRNHPSTPSVADSTPAPSTIQSTRLRTAFAGYTPKPRASAPLNIQRAAHPLAQAHSASPITSDSESNVNPGESETTTRLWPAPVHSPYDGAADRASFISTASSHDLTTHQRANTSFDPAMGFGAGAPGYGVGRFNAGKLNNYLHGLNRRLQEENEMLLGKLRTYEEKEKEAAGAPAPLEDGRRLSGGNRRVSGIGTTLGNVPEDLGEQWLEEKAELEEMVEAFKVEAEHCIQEKEEVERDLENERQERERDKQRWKERMAEVEQGVSGIISALEKKVEALEKRAKGLEEESDAQARELEKRLIEVEVEKEEAMERAVKAEKALESGKELGGALREANDRVAQVMGDLRNANSQIKELEDEVMRSDGRIDDLEKDLRDDKEVISGLTNELNEKIDALDAEHARCQHLESCIRETEEEVRQLKEYIMELEDGTEAAVARIEAQEDQAASARVNIDALTAAEEQANERVQQLEIDAQRAQEVARQMEEALQDAEMKMTADEEVVAELKAHILGLERDLERQREAVKDISRPEVSRVNATTVPGPTEMEIEALETELDSANKEVGRLTALLSQSPARKAMDKAKDVKIEMLEREKEELLERNRALRMTVNDFNTPSKVVNASGISPIHRQVLSMSVRHPKTPGGPLRDISWLNNATAEQTVSPFVAEISRLQRELDRANESVDDKLDKLEDAGLGVVEMTQQLEDARSRISSLEGEISRLTRKEERRTSRLARVRCQKCLIKVDMNQLIQGDESSIQESSDFLPTEPPTPPTKSSEVLRNNLHAVSSQLEILQKQWEEERHQLLGEKAVLEDATKRLNSEVRSVKAEVRKVTENERAAEKTRAGVQSDLERAKQVISELESDLKSERSRLRLLTTQQDRMQREKNEVMDQLQRTESDMDDVRKQLTRFKQENHDLERELRENVNAEQKARLLEVRVSENTRTIEQLRQERSILATDHKSLQCRFSDLSEKANRLRDEYTARSTSHENHRQQLDLRRAEIEDLRTALETRASDLQRAERERDRMSAERNDVARTVSSLEDDLRRVKRDAEVFGRDLRILRVEKEKLVEKQKEEMAKSEKNAKQMRAQIRLLGEQLEGEKDKTQRAKGRMERHICPADERQLSALKSQHNKECKGLIVQIRYLKAKFTRETMFRADLGYQKQYLLVLLTQFEKSEKTIFASIAKIGFSLPRSTPTKGVRKMKTVAILIMFVNRVKRASSQWREHSSTRQAISAALDDVRRRRMKAK